ncbi:MAG: hypothetical protein WBG92_14905, partial [Thiohalocapsa sp.]
ACIVAVDPRYFRPTKVETPLGDPTRARQQLDRQQLGYTREDFFADLVREMMREEMQEAERDLLRISDGFTIVRKRDLLQAQQWKRLTDRK